MLYLGLFGATALLLYLLISAQRPMSPHSTFAMVFVAACCAAMPFYRRSVYVDTSPLRTANSNTDRSGREPLGARLFRRFEKILNACISICAAWVIVLAAMQLYSDGLPAIARESAAALQTGTRLSGMGLVALLLLPLFHPVVDMTNWQRLAAFEKDASDIEPSQRPAIFRGILRIYAIETPLMSLFMCMFGVIAAVAMATPGGADAIGAFIRELAAEENAMASAALALLLVSVFAIALSTMSSLFSASLCTVRYDVLPAFWPERASAAAQTGEGTTRRLVLAQRIPRPVIRILLRAALVRAARTRAGHGWNGERAMGARHSWRQRRHGALRRDDLCRHAQRVVVVGRGAGLPRIRFFALRHGTAMAGEAAGGACAQ